MKVAVLLRILACVTLIVSGLPAWSAVCRMRTAMETTPAVVSSVPMAGCEMACCRAKTEPLPVTACCDSEAEDEAAPTLETFALASCAMDVTGDPVLPVAAPPVPPTAEEIPILLPLPDLLAALNGILAGDPPARLRIDGPGAALRRDPLLEASPGRAPPARV